MEENKQNYSMSVDFYGGVTLKILSEDNNVQEEVSLGDIEFTSSGLFVHDELTVEEKQLVYNQAIEFVNAYFKKQENDRIKEKAEKFLESIRNGTRQPDLIGYRS